MRIEKAKSQFAGRWRTWETCQTGEASPCMRRLIPKFRLGVLSFGLWILPAICLPSIADAAAYFDTAWTFTYHGGLTTEGKAIPDIINDVKILPNGNAIFVGDTRDSIFRNQALILELSPDGQVKQKQLIWRQEGIGASSILVARNKEYFVGGTGFGSPELFRLDSQFNVKSSYWHFDTVNLRSRLTYSVTLQSMVQTTDGRIIAVGGDHFPYNNGLSLHNYAIWMEFDSLGMLKSRVREWTEVPGYEIGGWSLLETASGGFLLGGNKAVGIASAEGDRLGHYKYTFSLQGVGTVTNNVSRVRKLRDGKLIAVGQAYEEDCWTRYQRLSYDGWWSFISESGSNDSWNAAGLSGYDDALFDATQLTDNRIAFLGVKGTVPDSGVWVFVTDSTAKKILWEKQFDLPGLNGTFNRNSLEPYTIVATPDTGFIVAGKENASIQAGNGFAMKFVPKPIPLSGRQVIRRSKPYVRNVVNSLSFEASQPGSVEFKVYDLHGKIIQMEKKEIAAPGQVTFKFRHAGDRNQLILWEIISANHRLMGRYTLFGHLNQKD